MESIQTKAVVRDGRVTVAVPDVPEGASVDVIVVHHTTPAEIERQLQHLRAFRRRHALPFLPPEEIKAMQEAGRP